MQIYVVDHLKVNKRGGAPRYSLSYYSPMSSPSSPHSATSNYNAPSPYSSASSILDDHSASHPAVMTFSGSSHSPTYSSPNDMAYSHDGETTFYHSYTSTTTSMPWQHIAKPNQQFPRQDSWQQFSGNGYTPSPSCAHSMSQPHHRVELDMLKTDGLSFHPSSSPPTYSRNIFDLSFPVHHQAPVQSQPNYNMLGAYYPPSSPQAQLHERYIQPSDLSPIDSPLSQDYPGTPDSPHSGCDPRHVSGVLSLATAAGRQSVETFRSGNSERDEEDASKELDGDDTYADDSFDDGDYDDEDDGDYVTGRRRRNTSKRNARRGVDRYTPYHYGSSGFEQGALELNGRIRHTGSDETSSISSTSSSSQRRSRAPATLPVPVPVPNLTKKSRGRHVPTVGQEQKRSGGDAAKARIHTCKVDGCGKCFARGEHLKRHIRSIHTHEKRQWFIVLAICCHGSLLTNICTIPSSQVSIPWMRQRFQSPRQPWSTYAGS